MESASTTLTRSVTLELIDGRGAVIPLDVELGYDSHDPYAVSASFPTGDGQVRWVFARRLLAEGIFSPAGDGDVHVWPCLDSDGGAVTIIELSSPDGQAVLQARSQDVADFLGRTVDLVPLGVESDLLDIDDTISRLLGTSSPAD